MVAQIILVLVCVIILICLLKELKLTCVKFSLCVQYIVISVHINVFRGHVSNVSSVAVVEF